MVLQLVACSVEAPEYDAEEIKALGASSMELFWEADYEAFYEMFDAAMAGAMDVSALETIQAEVEGKAGEFLSQTSVEGQVYEQYFIVGVFAEYSLADVVFQLTFDDEKKIAGFFYNVVEKEVVEGSDETETTEEVAEAEELVVTDAFEEVATTVDAGVDMPLDAILTLPKGVEYPPVVILVHGSGASDKNEEVYGNVPFQDIAHGLAELGIATLRYDKRVFAYPTEYSAMGYEVTLREETIDDANAAIQLMRNDGRVNEEEIYVLGHSLGGMLTPVIAAENEDVAGIISMGGSLRPVYDIIYDQNMMSKEILYAAELDDATKATYDTAFAQVETDIQAIREGNYDVEEEALLLGLPVKYVDSAKTYAGTEYIDEVEVPILVLHGENDIQVSVEADYASWEEALAGRENVTFHLYEGLNHLMMPSDGTTTIFTIVEEYSIKSEVDGKVIEDIAAFITQ